MMTSSTIRSAVDYGLESATDSAHSGPSGKIGYVRWGICGLLFFATTLNYIDRQVLALIKPTLQDPVHGIGLTEVQFAAIVSTFSAAYALGLLLFGRFVDKVGTRIGYAIAIAVWTTASLSHSFLSEPASTHALHTVAAFLASLRHIPGLASAHWVGSLGVLSGAVTGFGIARFFLGLGEAGNMPAAIKAVAEWFPTKERSTATGIFNSGTNIGPTIAPFVVGFLLYRFGWRYTFCGTAGFAMLGWCSGSRCIGRPHSTPASRPRKEITSTVIPSSPMRRYPGRRYCPTARPGPSLRARSSPIPSGGSICTGCPVSSMHALISPSPRWDCHYWSSITSAPSAAFLAVGSRRDSWRWAGRPTARARPPC